jgi:hypothetical protein
MAGLTREQRAEREAAKEAEPEAVDDGLIEVTKGDETLRVHPSCVKAHLSAGWKVKA